VIWLKKIGKPYIAKLGNLSDSLHLCDLLSVSGLKKVFIILSCIFFPVAGFLAYNWWHDRQKADAFQLIPESAVAVIETTELYSNWEKMRESYFWKNLQVIPFIRSVHEGAIFADSVAESREKLKSFFHGRKVISSLHVISNHQSDYIFYVPLENSDDYEMIRKIIGSVKDWKASERIYGGITIEEFTKAGQKISFSAIRYRNLLIGSCTGFLIEDVIRIINGEITDNFLKNNPEVISSAHEHSDTYIYLSYKKISSFLSLMSNVQTQDFLKSMDYFADHSVLDYRMSEKEILFDGFTYSKKDTHFLDIFTGQKPQKFNLKSYVPNNTGMLYYYGFDNPEKLNESLIKFWKKHDPSLADRRVSMNEQSGIDIQELYSVFGHEAALCFVNSSKAFRQGKLLFIESQDPDRFFLKLNKFVTIMKDGRKDTLVYEKLGTHLIREMNIPEFPSLLLGDLFLGFDECYYTRINNYIVFSDEIRHLRELIDNIDSENVWGKSLEMSAFLDKHFSASNVSMLMNTAESWKHLLNSVSPEIRKSLQEQAEVLKKISPVLFQFNRFQDKIYTNIVFSHALNKELVKDKYQYERSRKFELAGAIAGIPYSAFSGSRTEFLVHDSSGTFYLINSNGIRWKDTISAFPGFNAVSADLDKDGVKDLVFTAGNKIYSYDTSGKATPGFPIILSDSVKLAGISLADYEGNGNFRIIVNDMAGDIYMFDVRGKNLEGWQPRRLAPLSSPIRHIRVKGKDYFVALQKDGKLSVLKRRGEMYKGFPVVLGKACSSPAQIEIGKSPDKTFIHVLTDEGELIRLNLQGSIVEKKLFAQGPISKYRLLADPEEAGFMVSVQSGDQVLILNSSGEEVFQANIPEGQTEISYRRLKNANSITIFERDQQVSSFFLLDDQWKILFKISDFHGKIETAQSKADFLLFKFSNNIVEMGNIKLKQ
jgi:hypothetical protein